MGDVPTTTNHAAQSVNQIIEFALMRIGVRFAIAAARADFPFLSWPIVGQGFESVVTWFCERYLYKSMAEYATLTIIKIQTDAERSAYLKAEGALRAVHLTGDQNAIKKASDDFDRALAGIVHWDGSASP